MQMLFFTKKEKLNSDSVRSLFDAQKKTLIDLGYPEMLFTSIDDFNKKLESLWEEFIKKAANIEITKKGNVPLLLVISQGNVQEKIKKIKGHSELDFNNLEADAQIPSPMYMLLDVEDGKNMVAKSPKDALKKFQKEARHPLSINESVALLTHYPELLKDHYLISAGSFYTTKDNESLPLLWLLDEHENPELHYAWFHIAHGSYGTGSYSIKINKE